MVRAQAGLALGLALLVTACGGGGSLAPGTTRPWLSTRVLPGLGRVLVNREVRTLYVFGPDHARRVTCTGLCDSIWAPDSATRSGPRWSTRLPPSRRCQEV